MNSRYRTSKHHTDFLFTQVINEQDYPSTWDLHPLMGTYISVFYAPVTNTVKFKNLPLLHIYELIRTNNKLEKRTNKLRELTSSKQQKSYKLTYFPSACFAGTFTKCEDKSILTYSGFQCMDFDGLGREIMVIKNKICSLPQTILCFLSPRGNGLKVVYTIDTTINLTYAEQYKKIAHKLSKLLDIPISNIDMACQNVSRRCFLPYDPNCFLNPLLLNSYE